MDEDTGASSLQIRYPPAWSRPFAEHLAVDEELFILEGELTIGDVRYRKHDYAHLPSGYPRPHSASENGAVVLTFFSGEPIAEPGLGRGYDERRLVRHIDTRRLPPHQGAREHMDSKGFDHSGTIHKSLFHDPDTDERSWLVGVTPGWFMTTAETHPVVEEEFALYGDICMPNGIMYAGAYFWRPPHVQHGPFGSVGGTLHFCRCKGGAFSTEFEEKPELLDWNPDYRPILPESYKDYLRQGRIHEPNY